MRPRLFYFGSPTKKPADLSGLFHLVLRLVSGEADVHTATAAHGHAEQHEAADHQQP